MIKAKSLVRPFLKWVGGKRQLLASIAEHLPEQMNELRQLQLESLLTFSLRGFRETFGNDGCSYFYSQLVKDIKNEKTLDSAHLDSAVFL